jgi:hypothetical protein
MSPAWSSRNREVEELAVDVQLQLLRGTVPDPHRP